MYPKDDHSLFTSKVLVLQMCLAMPLLGGSVDGTQGFVQVGQVLYCLSYIPNPLPFTVQPSFLVLILHASVLWHGRCSFWLYAPFVLNLDLFYLCLFPNTIANIRPRTNY